MSTTDTAYQENVFPADYRPPEPKRRYDMVVVGGGTAGLVTAAGAVGLGADVALVEARAMGGDCLNVGCVPSKALIAAAREYAGNRERATADGGDAFRQAMQQVRRKRQMLSKHDSVSRFTDLGVDVFLARGRFTREGLIEAGEAGLHYKKAVIAVGASASAPPIPGLETTPFLTNENIFALEKRPDSLAIIGAGPIGVEMAQAFQRLGCQVHLLEVAPKILIREDVDAARIVERRLLSEGVKIYTGVKITTIEGDADRQRIHLQTDEDEQLIASDKLLVAAGRKPNTAGLGLENVGVRLDDRAMVVVNDRLQTTNSAIYSCGDVCSPLQFTHAADAQARIVIQNSLFFGRKKTSSLIVPWVTYCQPEIAHVGAYAHELEKENRSFRRYRMDFDQVDRAVIEEEEGFCEILADPRKGTLLGATIVHNQAGEMIAQLTQVMTASLSLDKLSEVIFPYPTQTEIFKKVADSHRRAKLTPFVAKVLKWILKL